MKSILLTIFLLIGFNSFTQDTISTTKGRLELIADELDISEQQAYESLVKEQRIQAYRNLIIMITMIFGGYFFKKYLHKAQHDRTTINYYSGYGVDEPRKKEVYDNKWIILSVITGLVFIVSLVYNSVMLSETFTGLFNPEYGALEQLEFLNK